MKTFLIFLSSFSLSTLITYAIIRLGRRFNLLPKRGENRWAREPKIRYGGVAIFLSFTAIYLTTAEITGPVRGILLGSGLMFALGLTDDIFKLRPLAKLAGQGIASAVVIYYGVRIEIIPWWFISIPLTVLWIVGVTNAFNLLDNMDGLAAGTALISSFIIFLAALLHGAPIIPLLSAVFLGSVLGFYLFNFPPAKLYMGDGGSMFIGFILSTTVIVGTWKDVSSLLVTLTAPALMLAVPIFDTTFVSIVRKLNGRAVSTGGKDHLSHRLVALGFSERRTVLFLYSISLLFGLVALYSTNFPAPITAVALLFLILCLVFFGIFLGEVKVYPQGSEGRKEKYVSGIRGYLMKALRLNGKVIACLALDVTLISLAYFSAFLLRYGGTLSPYNLHLALQSLPIMIGVKLAAFASFRLYSNVWRYVGMRDLVTIFKASLLGAMASAMAIFITLHLEGFSRAVFVIDWLLLFLLLAGSRVSIRVLRESWSEEREASNRLLIVGAGDEGAMTLKTIQSNPALDLSVVGFIDDDPARRKAKIYGVPVLGGTENIEEIIQALGVNKLLIATPAATHSTLKRIIKVCRTCDIEYGILPPAHKIVRLDKRRGSSGQTPG